MTHIPYYGISFLKRLYTLILLFCIPTLLSSQNNNQELAKFEPPQGQCLVFIGQNLKAVGGLDGYTNGYSNFFDTPAGVTVYTNLSPGSESFGFFNKGLDGLSTTANWGAGDSNAQSYLEDPNYHHVAIAIGLSMVDHEKKIAKGHHDDLIIKLAQWIKSSNRPIFLRIGYEFDGWSWNHYKRKPYLKAWKRIHTIFNTLEVDNVAFVWQSKGTGSNQEILEKWYPGDEIVDWCGYSYFGNPDREMLTFSRKHHKPIFIAEATPVLETEGLFFDTDLKKEVIAQRTWQQWFTPFFRTLEDSQDVIKAFSYINANWSLQPMWLNNPTFQKVDSRLQISRLLTEKWKTEMAKPRYLQSSPDLFSILENE